MFFNIMITHYMKKSIVEENLEGDSRKKNVNELKYRVQYIRCWVKIIS